MFAWKSRKEKGLLENTTHHLIPSNSQYMKQMEDESRSDEEPTSTYIALSESGKTGWLGYIVHMMIRDEMFKGTCWHLDFGHNSFVFGLKGSQRCLPLLYVVDHCIRNVNKNFSI